MTCASCKEPLPKAAKFCPECGVRLGEPAATHPLPKSKFLPMRFPERRVVTVVFCDLIGSAALSARLDAEDLREVLITYHRTATEIVETAGGVVAQFLGDGVLPTSVIRRRKRTMRSRRSGQASTSCSGQNRRPRVAKGYVRALASPQAR